ncbi:Alpha/Beta hydrolase protein, partial [Obelidium mucronatum]
MFGHPTPLRAESLKLHGAAAPEKRVLLINGSGQSCRMWGLALEHLKRQQGIQVCVFDGRGVGDATFAKPGFTMKDLANDVLLLLDHLKWLPKSRTYRYSMGGMVAQHVVLMAPQNRFRGVALVNTSAGGYWALFPPIQAWWIYLKIALGIYPLKSTSDIITVMLKMCFTDSWLEQAPSWTSAFKTNREFITQYTLKRSATKTRQTPAGKAAQRSAIWTHKLSQTQLSQIGTKTNIVVVYYLAKWTGGRFIEFSTSGHALFEQEHERFHQFLSSEFLV